MRLRRKHYVKLCRFLHRSEGAILTFVIGYAILLAIAVMTGVGWIAVDYFESFFR